MYKPASVNDTAPLHPGEVLRVDILPCLPMTARQLAAHLGLPWYELETLLNERSPVTLDVAQRLGHALGQGAHYWLALQMQYDLWHAQQAVPDGVRPVSWSRRPARRASDSSPHAA